MVLGPINTVSAKQLWLLGHGDPNWPMEYRHEADWHKWVAACEAAQTLGYGELWTVWQDKQISGFAHLGMVPGEYLPASLQAVECGTYLLPEVRGSGLNQAVKQALFRHASLREGVTWCVFVIPETNTRAIRAMSKLPFPFQMWSLKDDTSLFIRYLKRKSWECGQPCVLYGLPKHGYEPVHGVKPPNSR